METITWLEMCSRTELMPSYCPKEILVLKNEIKQWQLNKFLYSYVGAKWHWHDKLNWSDTQWREYIDDDNLLTYNAYYSGSLAGYFELALHHDSVEIAIFGLMPVFIGKGLGGILLAQATTIAWDLQPRRVWLHTCSLDHPWALANYKARGFQIYKTLINLKEDVNNVRDKS